MPVWLYISPFTLNVTGYVPVKVVVILASLVADATLLLTVAAVVPFILTTPPKGFNSNIPKADAYAGDSWPDWIPNLRAFWLPSPKKERGCSDLLILQIFFD